MTDSASLRLLGRPAGCVRPRSIASKGAFPSARTAVAQGTSRTGLPGPRSRSVSARAIVRTVVDDPDHADRPGLPHRRSARPRPASPECPGSRASRTGPVDPHGPAVSTTASSSVTATGWAEASTGRRPRPPGGSATSRGGPGRTPRLPPRRPSGPVPAGPAPHNLHKPACRPSGRPAHRPNVPSRPVPTRLVDAMSVVLPIGGRDDTRTATAPPSLWSKPAVPPTVLTAFREDRGLGPGPRPPAGRAGSSWSCCIPATPTAMSRPSGPRSGRLRGGAVVELPPGSPRARPPMIHRLQGRARVPAASAPAGASRIDRDRRAQATPDALGEILDMARGRKSAPWSRAQSGCYPWPRSLAFVGSAGWRWVKWILSPTLL